MSYQYSRIAAAICFVTVCFFENHSIAQSGWSVVGTNMNYNFTSIAFANDSTCFLVGSNGMIHKSTNEGIGWSSIIAASTLLRSIVFINDTLGFVGGGTSILKTTNRGNTWTTAYFNNQESITSIFLLNSNLGWGAGLGGRIVKYSGGQWTLIFGNGNNLHTIFFTDSLLGWTAGDNGLIFSTTNGGTSWQLQSSGTNSRISSLAFSNSQLGWMVGYNGVIRKTTNGGISWNYVGSPTSDDFYSVCFIDSLIGWIAGENGTILHSTNGGNTWLQQVSPTTRLLRSIHARSVSNIYITGDSGTVIKTTDGGLPVELYDFNLRSRKLNVHLSWLTKTEFNNHGFLIERQQTSFQQPKWIEIGFIAGAGYSNSPHSYSFVDYNLTPGLYDYRVKQIDNNGAFRYSESQSVVIAPVEFSLSQNYPNPFNPTTVINYQLPMSSHISLKIYDLLGREVATLVNEQKDAGSYEVKFDGKNLSSGIYFYQLRAGEFAQTIKLILQK